MAECLNPMLDNW